jgi:hypothetical protein
MVIDDYDIGFKRLVPHASDETLVELRALLAEACFGARVDLRPE